MDKHDNELTFKLTHINRLLYRRIDRYTLKYGLTAEQGRMILYLHDHQNEDINLTDLAASFHLRKSSLTSLLNNLEKIGCIKRTIRSEDQRKKSIVLTDLGQSKYELIHQLFVDNENILRETLSNDQISTLNTIFDQIIDSIKKF